MKLDASENMNHIQCEHNITSFLPIHPSDIFFKGANLFLLNVRRVIFDSCFGMLIFWVKLKMKELLGVCENTWQLGKLQSHNHLFDVPENIAAALSLPSTIRENVLQL